MNSFDTAKELVKQRVKKQKGKTKAIIDSEKIFDKPNCTKKSYSDTITSELDFANTIYCLYFEKASQIFKAAVLCGMSSVADNLLLDYENDIDVNGKYFVHLRTALHIAALNNDTEMLLLLLNKGADFSIKDEDGMTAVDYFKIIANSR